MTGANLTGGMPSRCTFSCRAPCCFSHARRFRSAGVASECCQDEGYACFKRPHVQYAQCRELLCASCASDPPTASLVLSTRHRLLEQRTELMRTHCLACIADPRAPIECRNLDCPHLYARLKLERQRATATAHVHLARQQW